MRDGSSEIKVISAFPYTNIGSATTTAGTVIDTRGFDSLTFAIHVTTNSAAGGSTLYPLLEDDDAVGMGTLETVAAADLVGTIAGATFAITDDDTTKKIGYRGKKRFVRLSIVTTGFGSGACPTYAFAILGEGSQEPNVQAVAL